MLLIFYEISSRYRIQKSFYLGDDEIKQPATVIFVCPNAAKQREKLKKKKIFDVPVHAHLQHFPLSLNYFDLLISTT